jgi:broad specificity phosphatase PhoE
MYPKLILIRHGNTFDKGDTVRWVGKHEDLPLSNSGQEQAQALAKHLQEQQLLPDICYTSTLKRTREFADLIFKQTAISPPTHIESILDEFDYGVWGGKTTDDIVAQYGKAALQAWEDYALIPPQWPVDKEQLELDIENFLEKLRRRTPPHQSVMVISSNGILRFILRALLPDAFEQLLKDKHIKMQTGRYGVIEDGMLKGWNKFFT